MPFDTHARVMGTSAAGRIQATVQPLVLASAAASLAWLFAHRVLGHPQPLFAPIAAAARATARTNTRVAPRRWRLRAAVAAEDQRALRRHALSSALLALIRLVCAGHETAPEGIEAQLAELAGALESLALSGPQWQGPAADAARRTAMKLDDAPGGYYTRAAAAILGTAASDLLALLDR